MINRYQNSDAFLAAVPALAEAGTAVGSFLKKLNIGGITPGIIDRKLAAGILGARSMGYSDAQMRQQPLYDLLGQVGSYPQSISNVVNGPAELLQRLSSEQMIPLPTPQLNATPYRGTPAGGAASASIIEPIFGKTIADLSRKGAEITMLPAANTAGVTEPISARVQEQTALKQMTTPVATETPLSYLRPFSNVMSEGLRSAGIMPPTDLESKAILFYDNIVLPAKGESFDNLDQSVVDGILGFIASVANRKQQGESLPPVLDKIGSLTLQVESKLQDKAQETVNTKVGGFVTGNIGIVLAIAAGLILFTFAQKGTAK